MYWFTSIFAAIAAAILVFMGGTEIDPVLGFVLALIGLILAMMGFFVMIALSLGHQNYMVNIVFILSTLRKNEYYRDWKKPFHYKSFHIWFFGIITIIFLALFPYFGYKILENPVILVIFLIIGLLIMLYEYRLFTKYKTELRKRKDYMKGLYPDFWEEIPRKKIETLNEKKKILNKKKEILEIEEQISKTKEEKEILKKKEKIKNIEKDILDMQKQISREEEIRKTEKEIEDIDNEIQQMRKSR